MTPHAQGNYIKFMFWTIAIMMVVLLGLLSALVTIQPSGFWKSPGPYSVVNSLLGLFYLWPSLCVFCNLPEIDPSSFFGLIVFFLPSLVRLSTSSYLGGCVSFFTTVIPTSRFSLTLAAVVLQTIWFTSILIELLHILRLTTFWTLFHLPCSKLKHLWRLVVRCYHTSRRPPEVRIDNSTLGFFGQLFCLCGRGIIPEMCYNY